VASATAKKRSSLRAVAARVDIGSIRLGNIPVDVRERGGVGGRDAIVSADGLEHL
jgi:hypothetical protein